MTTMFWGYFEVDCKFSSYYCNCWVLGLLVFVGEDKCHPVHFWVMIKLYQSPWFIGLICIQIEWKYSFEDHTDTFVLIFERYSDIYEGSSLLESLLCIVCLFWLASLHTILSHLCDDSCVVPYVFCWYRVWIRC